MAEYTTPKCPVCGAKNCRFNKTINKFVCNRCGNTGGHEEFGMPVPTPSP